MTKIQFLRKTLILKRKRTKTYHEKKIIDFLSESTAPEIRIFELGCLKRVGNFPPPSLVFPLLNLTKYICLPAKIEMQRYKSDVCTMALLILDLQPELAATVRFRRVDFIS